VHTHVKKDDHDEEYDDNGDAGKSLENKTFPGVCPVSALIRKAGKCQKAETSLPGKYTLAARAIFHLKCDSHSIVVFFFFCY